MQLVLFLDQAQILHKRLNGDVRRGPDSSQRLRRLQARGRNSLGQRISQGLDQLVKVLLVDGLVFLELQEPLQRGERASAHASVGVAEIIHQEWNYFLLVFQLRREL